MARSRRGRPVHGWLLIDKPSGITSSGVVGRARWALDAAKAGHAGTLDPAATGLLAVAFGEATKTVPYVTDASKCYRFTVRWGAATDTDDADGAILASSDTRPTAQEIEASLPAFRGEIRQVPPRVSAVKVAGRRAYDLAREGATPDLAARPLTVERLALLGTPDRDTADFELVCGKGGYVRGIARDLGRALGCLAHVAMLRRLWSGPFEVAHAVALATLEAEARSPGLDSRLLPVAAGLRGLPEVLVEPEAAARLLNGNPASAPGAFDWGSTVWASHDGAPVAIGSWRGGTLHPLRVFRLDDDG